MLAAQQSYLVKLLLILPALPGPRYCQQVNVKIGVVFSQEDWDTAVVKTVDEAVEMINRKGDVLHDMRLIYTPMVYDGTSFNLGKAVCEGISDGVKAVVS